MRRNLYACIYNICAVVYIIITRPAVTRVKREQNERRATIIVFRSNRFFFFRAHLKVDYHDYTRIRRRVTRKSCDPMNLTIMCSGDDCVHKPIYVQVRNNMAIVVA